MGLDDNDDYNNNDYWSVPLFIEIPLISKETKFVVLTLIVFLMAVVIISHHFRRKKQPLYEGNDDDDEKRKRILDSFLVHSSYKKNRKGARNMKRQNASVKCVDNTNNITLSSCWYAFTEQISRLLPSSNHHQLHPHDRSNKAESKAKNDDEVIYIGLDCEMVGAGRHGMESLLARCTLVTLDIDNHNNVQVLYDEYVKPSKRVTDYRTQFSGITPHHLSHYAKVTVDQCRLQVMNILSNDSKKVILVGHGLENDFQVLKLQYPCELIRDTATYRPLMRSVRKRYYPQKLAYLTKEYLNLAIQSSQHDSIEDAAAALKLYHKFSNEWEASLSPGSTPDTFNRENNNETKYTLYLDGCNLPMGLRHCEHYTTTSEKCHQPSVANDWFHWKCTDSSCTSPWRLLSSQGQEQQSFLSNMKSGEYFDWIPFFQTMLTASSSSTQQNVFHYCFEKIQITWDGASLPKQNIQQSLQAEISPRLHLHITERNKEVDDWIIQDIQNRKQENTGIYDPFIQMISIDRVLQLLSEPQNQSDNNYIVVRRSGGGTKTNKALFDKLHLRRPKEGALCLIPGLFNSTRFQNHCLQIARNLQSITSKSKQKHCILQFELHRTIPSITSIVVTDDVLLADRVVQEDSIVLSYWQFQHLF